MLRRRALRLALLAVTTGVVGCSDLQNLFGITKTTPDVLRLSGITILSDHPVAPGSPGGDASAVLGTTVRFTAVGSFMNVSKGNALSSSLVTGSVLWTSSVPGVAFPGADGHAVCASAGTTVIRAVTPSVGDIAAFTSNTISLGVHP